MNRYTVVGIYEDGSEGSFVTHTMAETPEGAAVRTLMVLSGSPRIVAVFRGHHTDFLLSQI